MAVMVVLAVVAVVVLVRGGGGGSFEAVVLGTSEGPAAEPGDEVWSVPLEEEGLTTVLGGEDVVLVTEDAISVHALDAGNGDELWTADLDGGDFNRAVPLKGGGVLLETEPETDEPLTRLVDARTGEERWEAEGEIPSIYRDHTSSDASSIHDLDVVVLIGHDDEVVGHDRETGEQRWELDGMEDAGACAGLVVATTDGISEGYSMVAADPATGEEVWSADGRVGQCRDGQVAVANGADITVHDAADGAVVDQLELAEDPGQVIAVPLADTVLVQGADSDTGETFVAIYPRSGGDPVYEAEGVLASPVGDDTLYLTPSGRPGAGTFVRGGDGEELGTTIEQSRDDQCFGAATRTQLVLCRSDGPEVVAYATDDGAERWVLDTSEDEVHAVGVVGGRLVVAFPDRVAAYSA